MTDGNLQSLGDILRRAREEQTLSLQEAEAQTRIRLKYLQALEDGDMSVMPSTTHARGFLRNYAQYLGLDVGALISQFAALTGTKPGQVTQITAPVSTGVIRPPELPLADELEAEAAPDAEPRPDHSAPPAITRPIYVPPGERRGPGQPLALSKRSKSAPPSEQPSRGQEKGRPALRANILTAVVLLAGFAVIVWWVTTRLSTVSGEQLAPGEREAQLPGQLAAARTPQPSPTFRPTSTPQGSAGSAVQFTDRVVLSITVRQRTWTRIMVDDELVFEGLTNPGEVLRFEGLEEILVRTGNGAGLIVNYNGLDVGPLGGRGEVVERYFTPGGQMTPTPTVTVTPTNTSVPSPTPSSTPTP